MHLPRAWVEIDLGTIANNLRAARKLLPPHCDVLGVVKGDAYGHGGRWVSQLLEKQGIAQLGVGDSQEAMQLRDAGITAPILVLGAVVDGEIRELLEHQITPTVHSPERIRLFNEVAAQHGTQLGVHLLIDTGMARLGVSHLNAVEHVLAIVRAPNLQLQGIGTHLASTGDPEFTSLQLNRFQDVVRELRHRRVPLPTLHVASSRAIERYSEGHFDRVRLGGMLYGMAPDPLSAGIRPALSFYTQVVYLRDLPADSPLGYGGSFRTRRPSRIATLPVGYHDGYLVALSNRAEVLIRGQRAPVVGRVTMDYVTVDVTDIPGVQVSDRVTLVGEDGEQSISTTDIGHWAGTTPYELPCRLGHRVRRFHFNDPSEAPFRSPWRPQDPAVNPEIPESIRGRLRSALSDSTIPE